MNDWPQVEIDPVMRLRALAQALPDGVLMEAVFDAPFERFWSIAGDLESGVPRYESNVRSARILSRDGDRLRLRAELPLRLALHFDVELRPGWCLMSSRMSQVGMAARAEGERTRFAHFEGFPHLGRLLRPLLRHSVRTDFEALHRLVGEARPVP